MQRPSNNKPHHTCSKDSARILRRRIVKETEDTIGRYQFGFRSGKGTRDTILMLRVTSE
jgi:hypothetical protein